MAAMGGGVEAARGACCHPAKCVRVASPTAITIKPGYEHRERLRWDSELGSMELYMSRRCDSNRSVVGPLFAFAFLAAHPALEEEEEEFIQNSTRARCYLREHQSSCFGPCARGLRLARFRFCVSLVAGPAARPGQTCRHFSVVSVPELGALRLRPTAACGRAAGLTAAVARSHLRALAPLQFRAVSKSRIDKCRDRWD
jgi:hypothetical protein